MKMADSPRLDAASGFAPGKLLLSGEHAVVHGHPAVALAVDLGTTVSLRRQEGPTTIQAPFRDERLGPALATLVPSHGLAITIACDLPIGRGMGSSAALAVALVRAMARLEGREASFAECHAKGFHIERAFHGNPSGVDHAVSAMGGAVVYRKTPEGPDIRRLGCASLPLVVLDSGSSGDTAALVAHVAAQRPAVDPILDRIGALTTQLIQLLDLGAPNDQVGSILTKNHHLLAEIGVSTPGLDELVALCLDAGACGAKLAGAGGGGVVLALAPEPERVLASALRHGVQAFSIGLHPPEQA